MCIARFGSAILCSSLLAIALAGAQARLGAQARSTLPDDPHAFLQHVNEQLLLLGTAANRAGWVQNTYITPDTEIMGAQANEALVRASTEFAKHAAKFQNAQVSPVERRQLDLLRTSLTMSAPPDPKEAEGLTRLVTSMEGAYGRGKYCPSGAAGEDCLDIEEITQILAESRDPKKLLDVWSGWHTIAVPMRKEYVRFVELSNKGAQAIGFKDTGGMWRSKYDMPPEAFAKELDRLWEQLRPLYVSLHA